MNIIFFYSDIRKTRMEKIMKETMDFFHDFLPSLKFESREGQEDMAFDIVDSMMDSKHILVEAGVGIGKSFAYLTPLLLYNKYFRKPVIIATSSIALQEQLIDDISTLSKLLHVSPEVLLAKGMRNYACLKKCWEVEILENTSAEMMQLIDFVKKGTIDRGKLPLIPNGIWNSINTEGCKSKECQFKGKCVYIEYREQMKNLGGVIVTNQDMLIKHLMNILDDKNSLFNKEVEYVVVDEGHNLEEKVRNAYTDRYSSRNIKNDIVSIRKGIRENQERVDGLVNLLMKSIDKLFQRLNGQIQHQIKIQNIEDGARYYLKPQLLKKEINATVSFLEDYLFQAGLYSDYRYDNNEDSYGRLQNLLDFMSSLKEENSDWVYWLNRNKNIQNSTSIEYCPKDINNRIESIIFENHQINTIITSATLADKVSNVNRECYSYFIRNTNFPISEDIGFLSPPKASPFPYDFHSIMYISEDMPIYNNDKELFIKKGIEEIIKLVRITKGKTLILFTSKRDMQEVFTGLNNADLPWKIMIQEEGSSQGDVLEEFRMDMDSILLGAGSFWEGINIKGQTLSSVIIFRLPFPVPDPVIDYKCSIATNKMHDVLSPHMILKLKQGIGRLIRSELDKGIVAILDSRISQYSNTDYREKVWEALPIKNKTNNLEDIMDFYERICKQ